MPNEHISKGNTHKVLIWILLDFECILRNLTGQSTP